MMMMMKNRTQFWSEFTVSFIWFNSVKPYTVKLGHKLYFYSPHFIHSVRPYTVQLSHKLYSCSPHFSCPVQWLPRQALAISWVFPPNGRRKADRPRQSLHTALNDDKRLTCSIRYAPEVLKKPGPKVQLLSTHTRARAHTTPCKRMV